PSLVRLSGRQPQPDTGASRGLFPPYSPALTARSRTVGLFADGVGGPVHGLGVNPGQVLTEDAQCKELSAREDSNRGCDERETRYLAAVNQIMAEDVSQHDDAECSTGEPDQACQL